MSSVKEVIALTFAYYHPGQILDSAVLEMYAGDLADIPPAAVMMAYQQYRRSPKNNRFPLPAIIREIVYPQDYISHEDQAAEVAARIVGAIPNYGWCNGRAAEEYIGPVGWAAVQRQGGWSYLCENMGTKINPSTFQAQIRKQLESNFKYGINAIEASVGARLTGSPSEGLTQIGDVLKRIKQLNEPEPEGAA